MKKNLLSVPIGIIDVFWDYEDEDEFKKAFYILSILNVNNTIEYVNNYYFLENDICVKKEDTATSKYNMKILDDNLNEKIKIQLFSDILIVSKKQYKIINETITNFQIKYNNKTNLTGKYL